MIPMHTVELAEEAQATARADWRATLRAARREADEIARRVEDDTTRCRAMLHAPGYNGRPVSVAPMR